MPVHHARVTIVRVRGILAKDNDSKFCVVGHVLPGAEAKAGDDLRVALARCVEDQTGCKVECGALVTAAHRDDTLTTWWLAKLVTDGGKAKWLSWEEVLREVNDASDRDALRRVLPRAPPSYDPETYAECNARHRIEQLTNELHGYDAKSPYHSSAELSLDSARAALAAHDVDGCWKHVQVAQRHMFGLMDAKVWPGKAAAILAEAKAKLPAWRAEAVKKALEGDVTAEKLSAAAALRDEHHQNEHAKVGIVKGQIGTLSVMLVLLCAALYGLDILGRAEQPEGFEWKALNPTFFVMLLGFIGGTLSAVRPIKSIFNRRLPELAKDWQFTLLRPIVGMGSALGFCMILSSKLLTYQPSHTALFAFAFAAGFSERFLTSAIGQLSGEKDEKAQPGTA
jgi:hypothetical protein